MEKIKEGIKHTPVVLELNDENDLKAKRNSKYLDMLDKSIAEAKEGGFVAKNFGDD